MTVNPGSCNLTIYKGGTFSTIITWTDNATPPNPINLTGYTAKMMIRASLDSPSPVTTLTTENGGISINAGAGTVTLSIASAVTATLPALSGVYDLEMIAPSGTGNFLIQGTATIVQMVTV